VLSTKKFAAPVAAGPVAAAAGLLAPADRTSNLFCVDPRRGSVNITPTVCRDGPKEGNCGISADGRSQSGAHSSECWRRRPAFADFSPFARNPQHCAMAQAKVRFSETLKPASGRVRSPELRPPRSGSFNRSQPAGISPTEKKMKFGHQPAPHEPLVARLARSYGARAANRFVEPRQQGDIGTEEAWRRTSACRDSARSVHNGTKAARRYTEPPNFSSGPNPPLAPFAFRPHHAEDDPNGGEACGKRARRCPATWQRLQPPRWKIGKAALGMKQIPRMPRRSVIGVSERHRINMGASRIPEIPSCKRIDKNAPVATATAIPIPEITLSGNQWLAQLLKLQAMVGGEAECSDCAVKGFRLGHPDWTSCSTVPRRWFSSSGDRFGPDWHGPQGLAPFQQSMFQLCMCGPDFD